MTLKIKISPSTSIFKNHFTISHRCGVYFGPRLVYKSNPCCVAVLPAASTYGKKRFFLPLSSYSFLMYRSRSIYELAPMTFDFLFLTWYHGVFVMAMFCVWNSWRVSCLSVLHCSLLSPNYSGVLNLLIFFFSRQILLPLQEVWQNAFIEISMDIAWNLCIGPRTASIPFSCVPREHLSNIHIFLPGGFYNILESLLNVKWQHWLLLWGHLRRFWSSWDPPSPWSEICLWSLGLGTHLGRGKNILFLFWHQLLSTSSRSFLSLTGHFLGGFCTFPTPDRSSWLLALGPWLYGFPRPAGTKCRRWFRTTNVLSHGARA